MIPEMKDGDWLFTLRTQCAHKVISLKEGTTVCKRKGLKFEPPVPGKDFEDKKCVTCLKTEKRLKAQEPKEFWRNPDTFASQYEDEAAKGADRY